MEQRVLTLRIGVMFRWGCRVIKQKAVRWAIVCNVFCRVLFSMHFRDFFCKFRTQKKRKRIVDVIKDYLTCCDVCDDFRIKKIFRSSLPPIVCCLRIVVSNTYCVVLLFCLSSYCVPYVAICSGFSIFDCPLGVL